MTNQRLQRPEILGLAGGINRMKKTSLNTCLYTPRKQKLIDAKDSGRGLRESWWWPGDLGSWRQDGLVTPSDRASQIADLPMHHRLDLAPVRRIL